MTPLSKPLYDHHIMNYAHEDVRKVSPSELRRGQSGKWDGAGQDSPNMVEWSARALRLISERRKPTGT